MTKTKSNAKKSVKKPQKRNRKPVQKHPQISGSRSWIARLGWAIKWLLVLGIWSVTALGLALIWFGWDIPNPSDHASAMKRKASMQILDNQGHLISHQGDMHGDFVTLDILPDHVWKAVLATEDRRFYDHIGFDPVGIARAMVSNITAGGYVQGGSTLTQQVTKNLFLTPKKTIRRKIQEIILSLWLEQALTKDQILTIYLNRVYLGAGLYGIDAAARHYFGVPASKLSLYQAAVIAGLPKAPSRFNPLVNPEKSATRANQVLVNMVAAGWLDQEEARSRFQKTVKPRASLLKGNNRRYFTDWVALRARLLVGNVEDDLIIESTLDPDHQRQAERAIKNYREDLRQRKADQIAFVSMTPSGGVTAMMGGHRWADSQYNRVTQAERQPGSVFKPLVYLAALESGMTAESQINDKAITIDGWSPRNASRDHRGIVTLRETAARSLNAATVAISEKVGRSTVINKARMLGMTGIMRKEPAMALGVFETSPLELSQAYAAFANGGHAVEAYGIKRIRSRSGEILYERKPENRPQIADQKTINGINQLLHAAMVWGTGKKANIDGLKAAGKTGTTQDFRDAWFAGYHRDLVAVIWAGNDKAIPTQDVSGGSFPALIWRDYMKGVTTNKTKASLPGF